MRHIHMLLFYIGLLALTSWAGIVLSIVILDANNNRTLELGYYVGLCKLRYRSIFFLTSLLMTKVLSTMSMLIIYVIFIYGKLSN